MRRHLITWIPVAVFIAGYLAGVWRERTGYDPTYDFILPVLGVVLLGVGYVLAGRHLP